MTTGFVVLQCIPLPGHAWKYETDEVIGKALAAASAEANLTTPDPFRLLDGFDGSQLHAVARSLMTDPLQAPYRAGLIESAFRKRLGSPLDQVTLTGFLAGAKVARGQVANPMRSVGEALLSAADPLAEALDNMLGEAGQQNGWRPAIPDEKILPRPLRTEVASVLAAIGIAERFRQRAFAAFPADVTPEMLLRQAIAGNMQEFESPDFRSLLLQFEREALMAGMQQLVAALEDLNDFLATAPSLPEISWTLQTPLGQIIVDTTGTGSHRELTDPLLIVDVGGNDTYVFKTRSPRSRISLVLDRGGNDRYIAMGTASCPSAAVMGYGILWDRSGDDSYEGGTFTQSAALFGATLLLDEGGNNVFTATGHAQGFAIGGVALLVTSGGDDRYEALTHAQGAGGPEGAAVLLDVSGNDRYTLSNQPLLYPSAQSASHNLSMGQGVGRGLRGDFDDGRSTRGGFGALFDLEGNDHYTAQVFAQGAAYFNGAGLLIDGSGSDVYEATWYAMGAAAHQAAAVFVDRGDGNDLHRASHVTSIAAAHDFSLAFFMDEGGDDSYEIGGLGLGAANNNGIGIFVDVAGNDSYTSRALVPCTAFGAARLDQWGTRREDATGLGLFFDLSGTDRYTTGCQGPANNLTWAWPRRNATMQLRSEAGAGIDGEYPNPFHSRPRSQPGSGEQIGLELRMTERRAWRKDPRYRPNLSSP